MDKRRIKRSVVTCAVLLGLTITPQAHAGWFSDRWDDIEDRITNVRDNIIDKVEDVVGDALEDSVVYLLNHGAGKGADYLIGLMLKLDGLNGNVIFDLMVKVMKDDRIITDDVLLAMMKNDNMIRLIGKLISEADTQERATEFFNLSMQRMLPIMMDPNFDINIIYQIPTEAYVMFSSLGSLEDNDDALEKAWEVMLKNSMSDPQAAGTMFGMLGQLTPEYQKSMMDFMFLGIDGSGQEHFAQSVNFNQAMIEGFAIMMEANPQAAQQLLGGLMPMLLTFDELGNMTGMTPYGMRFMTVLGTKMMTCRDASAYTLGMAFGQMMPGVIPPAINEQYACGRVEETQNILALNAGEITYMDSDGDGIPDFMDRFPGIDNSEDLDNDGTPDAVDDDIDGDGILNNADVDMNGDGTIDNGTDLDNDGINDENDTDIDGDDIPNESDPDIDNDGIINDADVDVNGDGINDNGTDMDNDGINDVNDTDIDGDGVDNDADADDDGIEGTDEDEVDTDEDGINDESDADNDGQVGTDDGQTDSDGDGINDESDTDNDTEEAVTPIVFIFDEAGALLDEFGNPVNEVNFDKTTKTYLSIILAGGNKSIVIEVPLDYMYTDEEANKFIVSMPLDENGSLFILTMTADGLGRVFMGRDGIGFEMTGDLSGMSEGEELIFSIIKIDGQLAGKTTIKPFNKNLRFNQNN
ncbi:OmpA-like transmembrane domain protein [hydrothermal vent metagenome]|uniref:OmpA-like transmembrane domain protein n=1 Tax=hydrothermal vent metagenome TaxID=652676 RepID=A0A1W1CPB4_9ZZZZ